VDKKEGPADFSINAGKKGHVGQRSISPKKVQNFQESVLNLVTYLTLFT